MKTLTESLTQYAHYHRDQRNIATHFFGVPMIVLGVAALLSRAAVTVGGVSISAGLVVTLGAIVFYFLLDLRFGLVMGALMGGAVWAGHVLAAQPLGIWLAGSLGLFVVGWAIQFVGHFWEGRKPAFVDDLVGLLMGPLFVVAEAGFALGLRLELRREIERAAGPAHVRTAKGPVTPEELSRRVLSH